MKTDLYFTLKYIGCVIFFNILRINALIDSGLIIILRYLAEFTRFLSLKLITTKLCKLGIKICDAEMNNQQYIKDTCAKNIKELEEAMRNDNRGRE